MVEQRYLISQDFRNMLRKSDNSLNKLSKLANFEVKNITSRTKTISESNLKKLSKIIKLPELKKFDMNYINNLGNYGKTVKIKNVRPSKNLAELIGIMLGDGNFINNRIHISFDSRHKKYIHYVSDLFNKIIGIRLRSRSIKGTNQFYLYCYNQCLANKFLEFGLIRGDKISNKVTIPNWIKSDKAYLKACLRGLVDTDGCIYFSKRDKQFYIKFTNLNEPLLNDFKNSSKKLGYDFVRTNEKDICLYKKEQVATFIKDISPFKSEGL